MNNQPQYQKIEPYLITKMADDPHGAYHVIIRTNCGVLTGALTRQQVYDLSTWEGVQRIKLSMPLQPAEANT